MPTMSPEVDTGLSFAALRDAPLTPFLRRKLHIPAGLCKDYGTAKCRDCPATFHANCQGDCPTCTLPCPCNCPLTK